MSAISLASAGAGSRLQTRLKATFVVDNKAGANGNIGATAAAATPGDGYHFLFSRAGTLAANKALYKNLSFDAQKDFVPILLARDSETRVDGDSMLSHLFAN